MAQNEEEVLDEDKPETRELVWDLSEEPDEGESAGEEPAAPTPTATERVRDPQTGRFTDGKAAEKSAAGDATPGAAPPAEEGTAPAPGAAAEGSAKPNAAAPAAREFTFNADGQAWSLTGSVIHPDGSITIPKDYATEVLPTLLAEGMAHRGSFREELSTRDEAIERLQWDLQESRSAHDDRIVWAESILSHFANLMNEGPEAVAAWLDEMAANRPKLEADMREAAFNAREAAFNARQEREEIRAMGPAMGEGLAHHLVERAGEFGDAMSQDDLQGMFNTLANDYPDRVWFRAMEDVPELGVRAGEIIIDADFVEDMMLQMLGGRLRQPAVADARNERLGVGAPARTAPQPNQPVARETEEEKPVDWTQKMTREEFEREFNKGSPFARR